MVRHHPAPAESPTGLAHPAVTQANGHIGDDLGAASGWTSGLKAQAVESNTALNYRLLTSC